MDVSDKGGALAAALALSGAEGALSGGRA